MSATVNKISGILFGRVARNIYIWAFLVFTVLDLNYNNEQHYHYGLIQSRWYWPFIIIGFIIQISFTCLNNFWLAPKFLRPKKYWQYIVSVLVLIITMSVAYTCFIKYINVRMPVEHLQQPGFTQTPVTADWSLRSIWKDSQTYIFSNAGWIFVFTLGWFMNEYGRQSKIIEEAKKKQTETELNFLKNQINPHFLFNTLNNLYGLALKHAENAPDAILKLSSILRYLLYESNTDLVAFDKERDVIHAYVELELLRITDTSGLHFTVAADRDNYMIPPLLWLPVLENLFKHGTRIITDDMHGDFKFTVSNDTLNIYCSNNYKGALQLNGDKKEGGIGLKNLNKRLELLYPGKYNITEDKNESAYTIAVKIDLR